MPKIRIAKRFAFEAAHALYGHDGACRNIHGHSYKMEVTLLGEPMYSPGSPKNGMVMDFSLLKELVNGEIIKPFDHALVLDANSPLAMHNFTSLSEKIILVPYQPTCENMVADFAEKIMNKLPQELKLVSLKLSETKTSYAEWHFADQ